MITRDDLRKRAWDFGDKKKCAMYLEASDTDKDLAISVGDISLQLRMIVRHLIHLSEVSNVSPKEIVNYIAMKVQENMNVELEEIISCAPIDFQNDFVWT